MKERIPGVLFQEDGHYLGRPADATDRIITRRVELVRQITDFVGRDRDLLEVGCGNGISMFMLADEFRHCTGIEITRQHEARFKALKEQYGADNCELKILDVVDSEPMRQYDRIISFEVIEHLSDESGLSYYRDALKKDGLMAISVPNKWWIFETHGARLPLLPWNRVPFFSWLPRPIHERFANARIYTKGRIRKLLEQYGFEILDIQYITAPMDVLPKGKFKDWIIRHIFSSATTSLPFKSTSIFVVARKYS